MKLYFIYTKKDEFTKGTGVRVFAGYKISIDGKVVADGDYTSRLEDAVFFLSWEDAKSDLDASNDEVIDNIDSSSLPFTPYIHGKTYNKRLCKS